MASLPHFIILMVVLGLVIAGLGSVFFFVFKASRLWAISLSVLCVCFLAFFVFKQPKPRADIDFEMEAQNAVFQTNLVTIDSYLPHLKEETLLVRFVLEDQWVMARKFTDYKIEPWTMFGTTDMHIDSFLSKAADTPPHVVTGRVHAKEEVDLYGWHLTLVKTGSNDIHFDKTQRFKLWMDKDRPDGYEEDGTPLFHNPEKRSFFHGHVDVIANAKYDGYVEPEKGDF